MTDDLDHYPHPSATAYAHGCDCGPCRRLRYRQTKQYRARVAATGPALVPADSATARVRRLLAEGFSAAVIAHLIGADRATVRNLGKGTFATVSRTTAAAVVRLTPARIRALTPDHMRLPALGSARRLRALQALGWPLNCITAEISNSQINWIAAHPNAQIPARAARAVATTYDRLSMRPGPSARTAAWAARHHLHPPLAWDDADIDRPDGQPKTPADTAQARREDRNVTVLALTAQGRSAADIASFVGCSDRTVVRIRTAPTRRGAA